MQTSSFWFVASATVALGALVNCSGSDFQSAGKTLPGKDDGGGMVGGSSAAGSSAGTGGRGNGGKANGGTTSAGGGANGGAAGTPGSGGSLEAGVAGGSPGGSGAGNATGSGGAGGVAGAGGAGGAVGCPDPTTFYPDADKDTFGRSTGTVTGCVPPPTGNWATVGGDCDDDDENVHPMQLAYFATPHSTSGGNHSFDYNCSGAEEGNPSQLGPAPNCTVLGCAGSGFVATSRTGPGVNALCGSTVQATCKPSGLQCLTQRTDVPAYQCR